jgi:hypothetical protein
MAIILMCKGNVNSELQKKEWRKTKGKEATYKPWKEALE